MPTLASSPALAVDPAPLLLTPYALVREAFDLWAMAYGAWFDTAATLSCACLEFCNAAASAHLAASGVDQPLLNDP